MKRRTLFTLAGAALIAGFLAFALQDVMGRTVILLLAYAWWLLGLLYRSVPELLLWTLCVTLVIFMVVDSLLPFGELPAYPSQKSKTTRGSIETLSDWITKAPAGVYYKWLIANRLGRIARELLAQRAGRPVSRAFGPLNAPDWKPPGSTSAYLESGLNGSFAEYPRPRWPWSRPDSNPLDLNPQEVVDYIESQLEEQVPRK